MRSARRPEAARRGAALLGLGALALAGACARRSSPDRPPEIRYGVDECSVCRMIVSDERYAAAATSARGETLRFDDPGCLVAALADGERWAAEAGSAWLATGEPHGWVPGADAWLVRLADRRTPMGSGLVAFPSEEEARRAAAASGAPVLRLAGLLAGEDRGP